MDVCRFQIYSQFSQNGNIFVGILYPIFNLLVILLVNQHLMEIQKHLMEIQKILAKVILARQTFFTFILQLPSRLPTEYFVDK